MLRYGNPGGGGTPIKKMSGMLSEKIEFHPWWRPIWAWLTFYLIPKRYHLKQNRLDYQSLFRRATYASRPDLRKAAKIGPKNGNKRIFIIIYFFECTPKVNWQLKIVAFCHGHPKWNQNPWFTALSETTRIILWPFHLGVPPWHVLPTSTINCSVIDSYTHQSTLNHECI